MRVRTAASCSRCINPGSASHPCSSSCRRSASRSISSKIMKQFANQIVVVTGAGHGIGRAVAERFAREGARVVVNDLDADRAEEAALAVGGIAVAADVSSKTSVDGMFDFVLSEYGHVDVLVNNAGDIY